MSKPSAHRQKWQEQFYLEQFIKAANLHAEIVETREAPDFIIRIDGRLIGIEVTKLFISHEWTSNSLQAQESIALRVVSAAQQQYQASGVPSFTMAHW